MGNQTKAAVIFKLIYLVEASGHKRILNKNHYPGVEQQGISKLSPARLNHQPRQKSPFIKGPGKWARDITVQKVKWQDCGRRIRLVAAGKLSREWPPQRLPPIGSGRFVNDCRTKLWLAFVGRITL